MTFHTLIASDIDGTLIPEESTVLPAGIFARIEAAYEKGFLFLAASGRQYPSLRTLFEPVADKMAFLIENGGGIYFRDELLYTKPIPRSDAIAIAKYVQDTPNCEFLADGVGESCVLPKTREFVRHLREVQKLQIREIESFDQLPDPTMKIAVRCTDGAKLHEAAFQRDWAGKAQAMVSGKTWIDFNVADKGSGLEAACTLFRIPLAHTVAFGDNWNDVPMLQKAETAYLMQTAAPELHKLFDRTCTNVISKLDEILAFS